MSENQPGERFRFSLPLFRERLKEDVLGEKDSPELVCARQERLVRNLGVAVLRSGHDIHTSLAKLIGDRLRNMNVHVKSDTHSLEALHLSRRRTAEGMVWDAALSAAAHSWRISASIRSLWSQ